MTTGVDIADVMLAAAIARPYYARAIAALRPEPACIETLAVTRDWRLLYSQAFIDRLGARDSGHLVAAHEVEHLLRDHDARARAIAAQHAPWNVAADAEINDDDPRIAQIAPCVLPSVIGQADGLLAEQYYAGLPECDACCSGGSGAGVPLPDEPEADESVVSAADILRDAVAADVRAYVSSGRGDVPRGVQIWADLRAKPVHVDWRADLVRQVGRSLRAAARGRDDYSWLRLARRKHTVLRPGQVKFEPKLALIVDTSGSMMAYGETVIGIVERICRSQARVSVVQCDASVTNTGRKSWAGGGGTDLRVAFDHAAVRDADAVVVVTDGETPWPDVRANVFAVVLTGVSVPQWVTRVEVHT